MCDPLNTTALLHSAEKLLYSTARDRVNPILQSRRSSFAAICENLGFGTELALQELRQT
jgi:hypothetical protein